MTIEERVAYLEGWIERNMKIDVNQGDRIKALEDEVAVLRRKVEQRVKTLDADE